LALVGRVTRDVGAGVGDCVGANEAITVIVSVVVACPPVFIAERMNFLAGMTATGVPDIVPT
jgi:hypothetical protein